VLLDDGVTAGLYTVGFLVGMALPGWRSLAGAVGAALGIGFFLSLSATGGVGAALGIAIVATGLFGLSCGIAMRAVTLVIAPLGRRPFSFLALAIVGYFVGPLVQAGPQASLRWLTRPSLASCRTAAFPIRVADQVLFVPGAPIFSVFVPKGRPDQGYGQRLGFYNETSLKEICSRAVREGEIIGPAILSVHPADRRDRLTGPWMRTNCASPRGERDALLCRSWDEEPGGRLERAVIYGSDLAAGVRRNASFKVDQDIDDWVLAGRPLDAGTFERDGPFEVRPNGLRVARGAEWTGASDEPFGLICSDGPTLLCAGAARLAGGGPLTRFTLRTAPQRLESDVRDVLFYLNDLVRVLAAKS